MGFDTSLWSLFTAFKSSVAEREAEPCVLVSVKNFPLMSMRTQSSSGTVKTTDDLASDLVLSHYFNLLCLVSLCINHNSTKARVPAFC